MALDHIFEPGVVVLHQVLQIDEDFEDFVDLDIHALHLLEHDGVGDLLRGRLRRLLEAHRILFHSVEFVLEVLKVRLFGGVRTAGLAEVLLDESVPLERYIQVLRPALLRPLYSL